MKISYKELTCICCGTTLRIPKSKSETPERICSRRWILISSEEFDLSTRINHYVCPSVDCLKRAPDIIIQAKKRNFLFIPKTQKIWGFECDQCGKKEVHDRFNPVVGGYLFDGWIIVHKDEGSFHFCSEKCLQENTSPTTPKKDKKK